jgi:hypothetical protein
MWIVIYNTYPGRTLMPDICVSLEEARAYAALLEVRNKDKGETTFSIHKLSEALYLKGDRKVPL